MSKMPAKKKSCFQITSVTLAQVGGSSGLADDAESLDDPDESHTDDVSSDVFDVPQAEYDAGAGDRSASEEALTNPGDGEGTLLTMSQPSDGPVNGGFKSGPSSATIPGCSSRFRVIKLDHGTGEPFRRGRWTCTEFYEKDIEGVVVTRTVDSIRHVSGLEHTPERDSGLGATIGSVAPTVQSGQGLDPLTEAPFVPAPHSHPVDQGYGLQVGYTAYPTPSALPPTLLPTLQKSPSAPLPHFGYSVPVVQPQATPPQTLPVPSMSSQAPSPALTPGPGGLGSVGQSTDPSPSQTGMAPLPPKPLGQYPAPSHHNAAGLAVAPPTVPVDSGRRKSDYGLPQTHPAGPKDPTKPQTPDNLQLHTPAVNSLFGIPIAIDGDEDRNPSTVFYQAFQCNRSRQSKGHADSSSGASVVAIDNKIEQAMDLVKSHLMYAVREEVEVLKEQIKELYERNSVLERENAVLKSLANSDQLSQLSQSAVVSTTSSCSNVSTPPQQPVAMATTNEPVPQSHPGVSSV